MRHHRYLLPLLAASASAVHGAGIFIDFDSYTSDTDLAGQGAWTITGASDTSGVSYVNASPFPVGSGMNAGQLGFQEIDGTSAVVSHPVSLGVNGSNFSVTTLIQDSNNTFPNRDRFGFTLGGSSGEIFGLYFTPTEQTATPDGVTPPRVDNWSWSNATIGESSPFGTLSEGEYTTVELTFTTLDPNNLQFALSTAGVPLLTDTISVAGIGNETFTSVGVVWTPLDRFDPGANSIYFDDLSFVPEPGTALLGAFGLLGLLRRRRA